MNETPADTRTLLQIDFPFTGPWGEALAQAMPLLARSIADEPGLIWKIWTENPTEQRAGGIYLFADADAANRYLTMHTERLKSFGIAGIQARCFSLNATLGRITRSPA